MNTSSASSRRDFLTAAASGIGLLAASGLPASPALAYRRRLQTTLSPEAFKKRVVGPILSVPTPFTETLAVDYQGVRTMVERGAAHGIGIFELTAGNSAYSVLTYDEIKELTRVLAEAVAGRGVVIAATGAWPVAQAVEYAAYAHSVGADAVQILLPPGSEDASVDHVRQIAVRVPLALVLQGAPPFSLVERLVQIPSVVSMKEDGTEKYYVDVVRKYGKRMAIFCGGQKWRYLVGQPYGSPAYFSTFSTFAPEIATRFWGAIEKHDMAKAYEIVEKYDLPFFDFVLTEPPSFPAYWRGFLEYFGVAKRYVRAPDKCCTDADMKRIAAFCDSLNLKPGGRA